MGVISRLDIDDIQHKRDREREAIRLLTESAFGPDEEPNSKQVRDLRKMLDDGKMCGHNGNKVHHTTLRNAFHFVKNGENIKRGSFIQLLYGCGTCPHHTKPSCQYGGEHENGGCPERYLFYRFYLVQSMGDKVPMMEEHLGELKFEAQVLKEYDMKKFGHVSRTWIVLQKLISDMEVAVQRAIEGRLIKVEKNITFNDFRNFVMRLKDERDQGTDNRIGQAENGIKVPVMDRVSEQS